MSRIYPLHRKPTLALRHRKAHLVRSFKLPPDLLRASLLERLLKCGKPNCHCHTTGPKHGPFFYLNRCFAKGQIQSLLLKSQEQIDQSRQSLAACAQAQEVLDEISQINDELLRRGEPLGGPQPLTSWPNSRAIFQKSLAWDDGWARCVIRGLIQRFPPARC